MASTLPPPPVPIHEIHRVSFSSDRSQIFIAHANGVSVFDVTPTPSIRASAEHSEHGGVRIAELLGSGDLLAVVGSGESSAGTSSLTAAGLPGSPLSARRMRLISKSSGQPRFPVDMLALTTVRAVRMFDDRIAVVLATQIRIFDFARLDWQAPLHVIDTPANSDGVCAAVGSLLAYPLESGRVAVLDVDRCVPVSDIAAHSADSDAAVRCLAFSRDGHMLATAGDGRVVRVFQPTTREHLFDFYRGKSPARIHCMEFGGGRLAVSSDRGTVHIFDLLDKNKVSTPGALTSFTPSMPWLRSWQSVRSAVGLQLPYANVASALCFANADRSLIVVTHHGVAYRYHLSPPGTPPEETVLIPSTPRSAAARPLQPTELSLAAMPPTAAPAPAPTAPPALQVAIATQVASPPVNAHRSQSAPVVARPS